MVLTIIAILALGLAATALFLPGAMQSAAIDAAYRGNLEIADQIKITRGYYTQNVVARAVSSGALTPSFSYKDNPKEIPLPATFVKDISDLLKEKETTLSLVSPYPWPHRADRKMDDFEATAWQAFQRDPAAVFSRQEMRDGKRVLRVAIADRMTAQTCVTCHNGHPQSAKRDWKAGDVRAVMQVTKVVEPYLAAAEQRSNVILWTATSVAAVAAAALLSISGLVARRTREKHDADRHVHYLAHHDALTGVFNPASFLKLLSGALRRRVALRERLAVHYIDLDGFKDVNDKLGHNVGDELIQCVAKRLASIISADDILARLGGDEFAVAQLGIQSEEQASQRAAVMVQTLSMPFELAQHQVCISASVGAMIASQKNATPDDLLKAADLALYRAKAAGRHRHVVFTPEMASELIALRVLEQTLRDATTNESFELHFQPICNSKTSSIEGFEALLRLPSPTGEMISPTTFIPIAEQIGLINEIGAWVIRCACEIAATWPSHLTVAVNLSPAQFKRRDQTRSVSEIVSEALAASGLAPHRLELEITESLLLEPTEDVIAELEHLKGLGVSLVMDDFGTGYSSLNYLWKLPLDKIKIDRSFVAASRELRPKILPIVQSITALGRMLHMRVTAEGVETPEQAVYFSSLSCDQMQGYLFGRPMPATDMGAILQNCGTAISPRSPDEDEKRVLLRSPAAS